MPKYNETLVSTQLALTFLSFHNVPPMRFSVVSLEGRAVHLATLVQEAEQRVSELQTQVGSEGPGEREGSDRERQLKAWEWRLRLFRRMQTGFEHASKASGFFYMHISPAVLLFIFVPYFSAGTLSGLS